MKSMLCVALGVVAMMTAGCGASPTAPSAQPTSLLEGTWRGTITVTPTGQALVAGPTTWTFRSVSGSAGSTYTATIESLNPWLPVSASAQTALVPPGLSPSDVSTLGDYASPRGCRGSFSSYGTTSATRFTATFHGVDCNTQRFDGSVELSR